VIPSGKHSHSELENGPVEIVDFPSEKMVDLSSSLYKLLPDGNLKIHVQMIPRKTHGYHMDFMPIFQFGYPTDTLCSICVQSALHPKSTSTILGTVQ
jgi:hypothetical protein